MTATTGPVGKAVQAAQTASRTLWVPLTKLARDTRVNTREVDLNWVASHCDTFDPDALGLLAVSERKNGTYVILDGQHRAALVELALGRDQMVECRIYRGLTVPEEAHLFSLLNERRSVLPVYRFLARVTEQDDVATAIMEVVNACGWRISSSNGEAQITAVAALEKIYTGAGLGLDDAGPSALLRTLRVVTEAWGYRRDAVNASLLTGLGMLFIRFGHLIVDADLANRLAKRAGGPALILGDAKGLRNFQGGSLPTNVADVVIGHYNDRRRSNRLPQWRSGAMTES